MPTYQPSRTNRGGKRQPPPLPKKKPSLLTPSELERYQNLLLFAQSKVDGFYAGKHRSQKKGNTAEFADFKKYIFGDDTGKIDWRVYARSRKVYLRQQEEETDMILYLLVDTSASMRYTGIKRQPKFHLAAKIAASLSYLMMKQGDKTALALYADRVKEFLPPGGTRHHLFQMIQTLEAVDPSHKTGTGEALLTCNELFKRRGQIVILSDFLDDLDATFDALYQFRHRGFEILLLQLLDPDELTLPMPFVAKFIDLETQSELQVDPAELRDAYQKQMTETQQRIMETATEHGIRHQLIQTTDPYSKAFEAYLGFREGRMG